MADALCGPSNALQNFQKHTTVDRTLQQDRVVGRHSPSQVSPHDASNKAVSDYVQGFRSSSALNAGALDSEFEAFQVGRPGALPQDFHRPPSQFAHAPPPHFVQAPQAPPGWATDFQRLNISNSPVQSIPRQQPQAAHSASSWHQDFMMQQAPAVQAPALQQQNNYGGISGYNMGGFGGQSYMQQPAFQHVPVSQVAQGKQPVQEAVPAFDEAAFEQAFLQAEQEAQQDMLDVVTEHSRAQEAQANAEVMDYDRPGEMDPLLMRIRETRPGV
jgi:hypothetical protein